MSDLANPSATAIDNLKAALSDVEEAQPMDVVIDGDGDNIPIAPEEKKDGDTVPGLVVHPGKKNQRYRERVTKLHAENNQITETAARLYAENQKLKADMDNLSRAGMSNYERALNAEMKNAKTILEEAVTKEDAKAQADAQAEIARIAGEQRDVSAYKAQNPEPRVDQRQPQQQQPQQQPQQQKVQLAPAAQGWIESNSEWFDPRSPSFDQEMHDQTVNIARIIEARYTRQGKQAEINTPKYFQELETDLAKEFPDRFGADEGDEEEPAAAAQTPVRRTPVAPATRSAQPVSAVVPRGQMKVSLTSDDVGFIKKNLAEGAWRYAPDHPAVLKNPQLRGQVKSFEDATKDFAKRKATDAATQRQR